MSGYEYYEFQALDRALTEQEQSSIASLSSRAQVSANRIICLQLWQKP